MRTFLNSILPVVNGTRGCGNQIGGLCGGTYLDAISKSINPLSSVSKRIDPLISARIKTTSQWSVCDEGFLSFFSRAQENNARTDLIQAPTDDEWWRIYTWLKKMNTLVDDGNKVLDCMLWNFLCLCPPEITVFVDRRPYDPTSLNNAFSWTAYKGYNSSYTRLYQMGFNLNFIDDFPLVLDKEYFVHNYLTVESTNLTAPIPGSTYTVDPYYYIGYIVHELGHVIDSYYYPLYYPTSGVLSFKSHVHAYMWQSYYYMSILSKLGGLRYFSKVPNVYDYRYLNLPGNGTCNEIVNALDNANRMENTDILYKP